jgi:hypothetical protein
LVVQLHKNCGTTIKRMDYRRALQFLGSCVSEMIGTSDLAGAVGRQGSTDAAA